MTRYGNVLGALVISLAAGPLFAISAGATTQSASSGGVTATFSYRGSNSDPGSLRLVIHRGSRISYDQPVIARFCGQECWPGYGRSPIHVRNLGPDQRDDVVLNLYSGGAHCCTIEEVFTYDASTKKYTMSQHDFGDPSAPLFDLGHNGRYEFESADDSFAYRFTDFAASGLPIEIVAFSKGQFVNVTRQYPKLIEDDARKWLRAFRSEASSGYSDSTGLIAAWAADEDSLGHLALVRSFLQRQVVAGHLNEAMGSIAPRGQKFVVALDHFLRQRGYLR